MSLAGRPSVRQKIERVRAVAAEHVEKPGLYYQQIEHDDWCPTLKTQRLPDCTCDPIVRPPKHAPTADDWLRLSRQARRRQA